MKDLIKKVSVFGLFILLLTSCTKYEDGPDISLIPRSERVANTWIIEKATQDGEDVTEQFDKYELYLNNNGDAELDAKYEILGQTFEYKTKGTWTFKDNDENIEFDFENDEQDAVYQILRLTRTNFWLRKIGSDLELHLKQK